MSFCFKAIPILLLLVFASASAKEKVFKNFEKTIKDKTSPKSEGVCGSRDCTFTEFLRESFLLFLPALPTLPDHPDAVKVSTHSWR